MAVRAVSASSVLFKEKPSHIFTLYPQEIIPWQMTVLWHPQHGIEVTQNSRQPKHV